MEKETLYQGTNHGLYNTSTPNGVAYNAADYVGEYGFWAYFIAPTAKGESNNSFVCLNTYDRAKFTFSFMQYAAIAPTTAALAATTPTQQLTATATDAKSIPVTGLANYVFQWFCDDTAVATVDQTGLITRVAAGSCNVTAIANGRSSNVGVVTCQ